MQKRTQLLFLLLVFKFICEHHNNLCPVHIQGQPEVSLFDSHLLSVNIPINIY